MAKKQGYKLLLGLTVLFTLAGIELLAISFTQRYVLQGSIGMIAPIVLIFLAGCTCVVRKRYFTEQ
ncbi:MAG: hypothetical protein ACOC41_08060 [Chitinivibrionales bacterium]